MEVKLKRPKTLEEGREYLWQENTALAGAPSFRRVTFVSYYPCPAFVVVRDEEGKKLRCLREEIFTRPIFLANLTVNSVTRWV